LTSLRFENLIPDIRDVPILNKTLTHFATDWIWVIDSIDGFKSIYETIVQSPASTVKMLKVAPLTRSGFVFCSTGISIDCVVRGGVDDTMLFH
jgi:hypothetical protein